MPRRHTMLKNNYPLPENTVYVGGGTKWANTFRPGKEGILVYAQGNVVCTKVVKPQTLEDCLRLYRKRLECLLKFNLLTQRDLQQIRGKNLASFHPKGQPCYVDILLEVVNVAQ